MMVSMSGWNCLKHSLDKSLTIIDKELEWENLYI